MNFIRRFMAGRYGSDQLGMAIIILCIVLNLISAITGVELISTASLILLVLCIFRMFSRNYARRQAENIKFLKLWTPIKFKVKGFFTRAKSSRTHKHLKCPDCGNKLRVPRGKGRIRISCPKCGSKFETKT